MLLAIFLFLDPLFSLLLPKPFIGNPTWTYDEKGISLLRNVTECIGRNVNGQISQTVEVGRIQRLEVAMRPRKNIRLHYFISNQFLSHNGVLIWFLIRQHRTVCDNEFDVNFSFPISTFKNRIPLAWP